MQYYQIKDLRLVGRIENHVPYLHKEGSWRVDKANILMDRIMGYDGESIGATSMLTAEPISESEAMRLIGSN